MSIAAITSRSVELALSGCSGVDTGKYSVRYTFAGGSVLTAEIGSSNSMLTVTELRAEMQYTFTVTCANSAGVTGPNVTRYANTSSEGLLTCELF